MYKKTNGFYKINDIMKHSATSPIKYFDVQEPLSVYFASVIFGTSLLRIMKMLQIEFLAFLPAWCK